MKILNFVWRITERIVKYSVLFMSKGSNSESKKMPRRRPLYTCVASIFAIIHIACRKTEDFNGPIRSIIDKIAICMSYVMPILYTMQFQWLLVVSFIDNCILTSEIMVEKLFPPASRLFDKIDELAYAAESLPGKFDDSMEKLPIFIHQIPFLDWALFHLIAWLNFWISRLTHWGSRNAREKDITIDVNHNDQYLQQESTVKSDLPAKLFSQLHNADASHEQIMGNDKSECGVDEKKITGSEIQAFVEAISPASSSSCDPFEDAVSSPMFGSHEDVSKTIEISMSKTDIGKCSYKEMLEKRS
ncbi:uncharacterized protein LOC107783873 [Nicotiana tabacum]|uniref:Uncharacterized protein LOC107783873 n=3 Tax=Nicotiana TaxID=4085 RepID=A0A1S3Z7Q7_TOBAC|nr:PREDICTED: uncharacterized protein LOC104236247 isoform X1 [Nicotiana sylvestris]XP_016460389.1 PREDICTED: uncharacterized protein LOC107783873 [Nicotiana tabacum]